MAFLIDDLIIAALISAGATMGSAALTENPTNKTTTTGAPAGGPTAQQAQDIFQQGQPTNPPQAPPGVNVPLDPMASGSIGQLLAMMAPQPQTQLNVPNSPMPSAQAAPTPNIMDSTIAAGRANNAPLNVPYSPSPAAVGTPPAPQRNKIGDILTMAGSAADALAKVAPLLGLTDEKHSRGIQTGSPAGGQPGQSIFSLPQRQTLAQILNSLPRTM